MALQKKLQETKYGLKSFWFGSGFIYAWTNLNLYKWLVYGWAKEKAFSPVISFWLVIVCFRRNSSISKSSAMV